MGDLLDAIAGFIDRGRAGQVAKGGTSWWWWLVGGAIAAAGVALGWWLLRGGNRELAQLRHARFRAEQDARNAEVDAQLKAETDQAASYQAEAEEARVRQASIELEIHAAKLRHAHDLAAVDRIRSWRDVAPDPR